jgi:hypothetical protein
LQSLAFWRVNQHAASAVVQTGVAVCVPPQSAPPILAPEPMLEPPALDTRISNGLQDLAASTHTTKYLIHAGHNQGPGMPVAPLCTGLVTAQLARKPSHAAMVGLIAVSPVQSITRQHTFPRQCWHHSHIEALIMLNDMIRQGVAWIDYEKQHLHKTVDILWCRCSRSQRPTEPSREGICRLHTRNSRPCTAYIPLTSMSAKPAWKGDAAHDPP